MAIQINSKIEPVQISDIEIEPLSSEERKKIIQESFGEVSELNAENIEIFLLNLKKITSDYLKEYKRNWSRFEQSFNLINRIQNKAMEENLNSAYARLKNQQGNELIAKDFIRTLEKGNLLLDYIREMITGQSIITNFTIKASDNEVYLLEKKEVPYKLALSTYGSSGNNFVSLAYSVDVKTVISELRQDIENSNNRKSKLISGTDIYNRIYEVKLQYLADLQKRNPEEKYEPRFDSKDAEIFDLFSQRMQNHDFKSLNKTLTKNVYYKLRKTMGGRGGYRTSSTKLGDVGLIQDKMLSQQINQVNFARQTLIKNRFEDINKSLNTGDKQEIKNMFLNLFTENQNRVDNNISQLVNKEAIKMIKSLFK